MLVLGIETSCDETAAAVVRERRVLSNVVASQLFHGEFGGVVPELASRAHLRSAVPVVQKALDDSGVRPGELDGVAVTAGPGLVGSLLVGLSFGKAMAYVLGIPVVGVDHLAAHAHSIQLEWDEVPYPVVCLVASGGHTCLVEVRGEGDERLLGETLDDAAGEVLDKVARLLGLGYPGGASLEKLARGGRPEKVPLPRPLPEGLHFSFSGLKTAVRYTIERSPSPLSEEFRRDIAAACQAAVVDVLTEKARRAAEWSGARGLALAGGVGANQALREGLRRVGLELGIPVHLPSLVYCTDNAAMVAARGALDLRRGRASPLSLNAYPTRRVFPPAGRPPD